ncbi:MAG: tRNA 2-thiouridine(34) synthase MnmA [Actinobacteria bacterium]|nr:tRNA 2-thiouridine(34) synthase MnmA [Actinomycetota bacterium]
MTDLFLDHFNNPRNCGAMADAHGAGRAGDPGCGVVIEFFLRYTGSDIATASSRATGSSAAIACGSMLTEMVTGKDWRHVAAISEEALISVLAGGGEAKPSLKDAARFALEALHAALEDSLRRDTFPRPPQPKGIADIETMLVAMSGGVDSSVACLLEREAGRQVTGVTMRLWSDPDCDQSGAPTCCSPQAIRDARAVCHSLGLPHLTVDYTEDFAATVVDAFVDGYLAGLTPNPCTFCNGSFRFPALVSLADRLGSFMVATGHYARQETVAGRRFIVRAADSGKDQSYMLWGIPPSLLERLEFPLGGIEKEETRRLAREAGLQVHDRPESQEVCFIPDDDYRRFVRSRAAACGKERLLPGKGDIVDTEGNRLGAHMGFIDFTIGQRHGLGVSAPEPLYVLRTVPERNEVVAGPRAQLQVRRLTVGGVNSFTGTGAAGDLSVSINADAGPGPVATTLAFVVTTGSLTVQVRYNSQPAAVRSVEASGDTLLIETEELLSGVAPGQSAVFYSGDILLAGGVIDKTS